MSEEIEETSTPEPSLLEKIGVTVKGIFLSLFSESLVLSTPARLWDWYGVLPFRSSRIR